MSEYVLASIYFILDIFCTSGMALLTAMSICLSVGLDILEGNFVQMFTFPKAGHFQRLGFDP